MSTLTTLSPRLIFSSPAVNSNPNVCSIPVSWNVWRTSCSIVTLSVVTWRIPLPLCLSVSEEILSLPITSSLRTSSWIISVPVQEVSTEFQYPADIPPFSRSSTPRSSAIPSKTESTLTISGVGKITSSIQWSVSGLSSIDPAYRAMWNGFKFSVLVANGWSTNVTSVKSKVRPDPFLVIFESSKSAAQR